MIILRQLSVVALLITVFTFSCGSITARAQERRRNAPSSIARANEVPDSRLSGVFRIDPDASDKLYSVISGASSNLPFGEQQRFFIDLTVRLTPPDQLAVEKRGTSITIASSRAPRLSFEADGVWHRERVAGKQVVRTRAVFDGDQLLVSTFSNTREQFTVTFDPIDGGRRLRVTRRIFDEQLDQPVIIQSVYQKISEVARWDIYGRPEQTPTEVVVNRTDVGEVPASDAAASEEARRLREALAEWVAATNSRDIEKQLSYYAPRLKAFYLTRDVSLAAVRAEKQRIFARADIVDVQAQAPEIIFRDTGRTAIMRFRKRYLIESGMRKREGEVVQELHWNKTDRGWKILSERDVRVLR